MSEKTWMEIAAGFLKIGATAYGGPAIMGVMQAELQDKRGWVTKPRFVDGLALVNMLPGATAAQLAIFLGYSRGGWWGGLLAGVCFVAPAFVVMLALTIAYGALGVTPIMRGALYGLGPVVLGIFGVAIYRLGRTTIRSVVHGLIGLAALLAAVLSPLGIVAILLLAAGIGIFLFHSRRAGAVVLLVIALGVAVVQAVPRSPQTPAAGPTATTTAPSLRDIGVPFLTIGAFTFGGGLAMLAFVQDQVVTRRHWLTPEEFIDGLALGQFTPGPILMLGAYVGYKVAGLAGAVVGATAIFLPSFVLMLCILPLFERVRQVTWARAAMQGIGPAVIGVLAVSLAHLAPHALPDRLAVVLLAATVVVLLTWRVAPLKVMLAGAIVGMLRSRVCELPGVRTLLCAGLRVSA
jgi:chromate transporter